MRPAELVLNPDGLQNGVFGEGSRYGPVVLSGIPWAYEDSRRAQSLAEPTDADPSGSTIW